MFTLVSKYLSMSIELFVAYSSRVYLIIYSHGYLGPVFLQWLLAI